MSEARDQAVLNKWQRKLDRNEAVHDAAKDGLKKFIKSAMKDDKTRKNIIREALDTKRNSGRMEHRESYGDDNEIITGFANEMPWERDVD